VISIGNVSGLRNDQLGKRLATVLRAASHSGDRVAITQTKTMGPMIESAAWTLETLRSERNLRRDVSATTRKLPASNPM
jgi:hypothetical protein